MKTILLRLLAAWKALTNRETVIFSFNADRSKVEVIATEDALDEWAEKVIENTRIDSTI